MNGDAVPGLAKLVTVTILAVAVTACGGGASTPAASGGYMTAGTVASRLEHLGCQPIVDDTSPTGPVGEVECSVSGEHVTVQEYRTAKDLSVAVPALRRLGCMAGVGPLTFVEGLNWLVAARSRVSADAVRSAVGGRVVSGGC